MHTINGNVPPLNKKINIIQINTSNANFNTKLNELRLITERKRADVVIVSESNMETNNVLKINKRQNKFPNYTFIDKVTGNSDKARVTLMIDNDIKFERLPNYEDNTNPMIVVRVKETRGRHLVIVAIYRQWKAPGETEANTAEGIGRQCLRLKDMTKNINALCDEKYEIIIGGDLNIDRHLPNDPLRRPEVRALTPILEDIMMSQNIAQLNFIPTRHQNGCNSSLFDLFLSNIPERISNVENFTNITSEHEGVSMILHTKTQIKKTKIKNH